MRNARRLGTIALALLLTGCFWQGPAFYKADPSIVGPIAPGRYKADILGDHKPAVRMVVVRLADGSLLVDDAKPTSDDQGDHIVLAPLAVAGRDLWIVQTMNGPVDRVPAADDDVTYGLMERRGDILAISATIDCVGTETLVQAAGGMVSRMSASDANGPSDRPYSSDVTCRFPDRAALERALVAYAALHPQLSVRVRLTKIAER